VAVAGSLVNVLDWTTQVIVLQCHTVEVSQFEPLLSPDGEMVFVTGGSEVLGFSLATTACRNGTEPPPPCGGLCTIWAVVRVGVRVTRHRHLWSSPLLSLCVTIRVRVGVRVGVRVNRDRRVCVTRSQPCVPVRVHVGVAACARTSSSPSCVATAVCRLSGGGDSNDGLGVVVAVRRHHGGKDRCDQLL
jgi:hypothetical protein